MLNPPSPGSSQEVLHAVPLTVDLHSVADCRQPYERMIELMQREVCYWRDHEQTNGPLPCGGLSRNWDRCFGIYATGLRMPDRPDEALRLFLMDGDAALGSTKGNLQLFEIIWRRLESICPERFGDAR